MLQAVSPVVQIAMASFAWGCLLLGGNVLAVDYELDIKPIFEEKCYACHGALKQSGGLRLDTAQALIDGGDSGSPVEAGAPQSSLLIDVLSGQAGFQMPPASEGSPLSSEQIDLVRQWILDGANHPKDEKPQQDPTQWWSYQPMTRPDVPAGDRKWSRNPVDSFISDRRAAMDLPHAQEASKEVWLRRVYLDLIGLPPTVDEQQNFLADDSPLAYKRVVDDLLNRPQYGERWGRHWMDVWRYSDWYGSRGGNEIRYSQRHIWRWRDWIVDSLNHDKGYDQMLTEMLAGDEIGKGDPDVMVATGFLGRNWYKFDREAWIFETVERTSEAFLGLTMRCCRCHDHKFDPVTQQEYYRFKAIFDPHDVRTDLVSALTPTEKDPTLGQVPTNGIATVFDKTLDAQTYVLERGDSRRPDQSREIQPGVPDCFGTEFAVQVVDLPTEAWYPTLRRDVLATLRDQAETAVDRSEQKLRSATDESTKARELLEAHDVTEQEVADASPLLADDFDQAHPEQWEILSGDWQYVDGALRQSAVTSFATMVTRQNISGDFRVRLRYRTLQGGTYRSVGFSFDYLDGGNSQDVYTSTGDQNQSVQAFHRIDGKQVYPPEGIVATELAIDAMTELEVEVRGSQLTIDLNGQRKLEYDLPVQRRSGRFALWVHQGAAEFQQIVIDPLPVTRETLEAGLVAAQRACEIASAEADLARAEQESLVRRIEAEVARYDGQPVERWEPLAQIAAACERQAAVCKAKLAMIQAATESAEKQAEAAKVFDEAVKAAEHPGSDYQPVGTQYPRTSTGRRTALARWLTQPRHPRTARVAVNHLWGRHFGVPLAETTENLGLAGRSPSHPNLIDWLACELVDSGWSMKHLHRMIVLSSTYRMATSIDESPEDNGDRLMASAKDPDNRYLWRMNSRRMEAEVVRDATLHLSGSLDSILGGKEIDESKGETIHRRSMYFRNTPNESMTFLDVFDMADPNACYRRRQSIVPHQSLAMMNSGMTQDAARRIASQLAKEVEFIATAFQTVLGRAPRHDERARCETFLVEHAKLLKQEATERFAAGGSAKAAPATDPDMRARENLVHVLLLHNEFVTVR